MLPISLLINQLRGHLKTVRYFMKGQKPSLALSRVCFLNEADAGKSVVRVLGAHINGMTQNSDKLTRGELVRIKNLKNGRTIVRMVLGSGGNYPGLGADAVAVDYDALIGLGIQRTARDSVEAELHIRPATPGEIQYFYCFEYHASSERLAHINGYIGLWLGWVGLFLGILSILN